MNIHLEYLTGTWLDIATGVWGLPFAAQCAQTGGQTCVFHPERYERVGWIGRE